MIAIIKGNLIEKYPDHLVISANGIGYLVQIPLSTYYKISHQDQDITLFTHTILKENAIDIYGFLSRVERELFKVLINASGIGPKVALGILSSMEPSEIISTISTGNTHRLKSIPGVGKKLAERLIFELKDKIKGVVPHIEGVAIGEQPLDKPQAMFDEAVSALVNLGYPMNEARDAVSTAAARCSSLEELIKEALKGLGRARS